MNGVRLLAAAGLAVGAVFGFAGGFAPIGVVQDTLWLVSSLGLVVGCLFVAWMQHEHPVAGVGFMLLGLAEMLIHAGGSRSTDVGQGASFAAGLAFYVPALLLIAAAAPLPLWMRGVTAAAAIPFAIHVAQRLAGQDVGDTNLPAKFGYALLTVAVLGWAWAVAAPSRMAAPADVGAAA